MNFSRREKNIFLAAALIIAIGLVYNFIIEPFFKRWNSINSKVIAEKIRIKKGLRLLDDKDEIIKGYNLYASSVNNLSNILSYIEKEAAYLNIKTANIKPKPIIQNALYGEYIIEVQIEGSFSSINKFAANIIKPPAYLAIKKFDLRAEETPSPYLKGTLVVSKIII